VLFTVADIRRMQLLAEIAESDVASVRPGSKAAFQIVSIGSQSFEGTVSSVRLQPLLQQVAGPGAGGPASPAPQAATSTPMAGTNAPAQPANATSPAPTGTSGTAGSTAGPSTQPVGAMPPQASGTQSLPPSATFGRAESTAPATSVPAAGSSVPPAAKGVVTYLAVIDVHNASGVVPPGGSAIVFLPGQERRNVLRVPNNALTFRPSTAAFAAVGQDPPILDAPLPEREQARRGVRLAHVWTFENRRFTPIAVEAGVSDDLWTEVVGGALRSGDVVVTDAVPAVERHRGER
jgi:hypothetical protein